MQNVEHSESYLLRDQAVLVIIEDDASQLDLIKNIIFDFFPQVTVKDFLSPLQAFDFLCNNRVDLVLIEYFMKEMDGFSLIRRLREEYLEEKIDELPSFIICTEAEDRKYLTEAFSLGVLDYVIKPFSPSELEHRITRAAEFKEMAIRIQNLKKNSYKDSVTKLWNAQALEKELERLYTLSERYKMDYSILMLEIDYAKEYILKYSEENYDNLLFELGEIILDTIRSSDFAGKFSKSEIIIILPFTDEEGAKLLAWRILKRLLDKKIIFSENQPYGYATFTAGVAMKEEKEDILTVLRKADESIYHGQKYEQKVVSFSDLIKD